MLDLRTPHDFVSAFKRRKWLLAIPLAIGIGISSAAALLWPPVYRSVATILIEEPEVPRDLVSSTVSSYADERIQVISQRVMTTPNLISVIDKYGLYREKRKFEPIGRVAKDMRDDINLKLVSADVIDPRSGRPGQATIAFTLSFDYRTSRNSQKVLNELVTLFLAENLRTRREAAAETTSFLRSEAKKLSEMVDQFEQRLAQFKQQHAANLPEQIPLKIQLKDRTERDLLEVTGRMQTLSERRIYLDAELAQLSPYLAAANQPRQQNSSQDRLKALRLHYVGLTSKYGPNHPDVREVEREIEALEKEVGPEGRRAALEAERDALSAEIQELKAKYSSQHPDVQRVRRQYDSVVLRLETIPDSRDDKAPAPVANPAYVQLQAQLEAVDTELRSLKLRHEELRKRQQLFEQDILAAPEVERAYRLLLRDYNRVLENYNVVKTKLTTAELGEALEAESKAEQFSLVEPPSLPTDPVKPNRLAILVLGIALSLAAGGGLAAWREAMDTSVYGPLQLASVTGSPPLVVVPNIVTPRDVRRKWIMRAAALTVLIVIAAGSVWGIGRYVMPLDVLMAVIERNIEGFMAGIKGD